MSLRFVGIATFAKVPPDDPAAHPAPHAAVLGIPTDEGATQHTGARYGPRAIRDASMQFPYYGWWDGLAGEAYSGGARRIPWAC